MLKLISIFFQLEAIPFEALTASEERDLLFLSKLPGLKNNLQIELAWQVLAKNLTDDISRDLAMYGSNRVDVNIQF